MSTTGGDNDRGSPGTSPPATARDLRAVRRCAVATATAMRHAAAVLASAEPRESGELCWGGEPLTTGRLRGEILRVLESLGYGLSPWPPAGPWPRRIALAPPWPAPALPDLSHSESPDFERSWPEPLQPTRPGIPAEDRVLRASESWIIHLRTTALPRPAGKPTGPPAYGDCARTFCLPPIPQPLARAHRAVLAALDVAAERLEPRKLAANARAFSLQDAVYAHFQRLGYPHPLTHPDARWGALHDVAHGVGETAVQPPIPRRGMGDAGWLATGQLLALHPGLYGAGAGRHGVEGAQTSAGERGGATGAPWGVRVGDLVLLTETGPEWLTSPPRTLDPRHW